MYQHKNAEFLQGGYKMTEEEIKKINRSESETSSIESWASWYEGEEGWGVGGDDD